LTPPGICKQNQCHAVNEGSKKCANQYFTIWYEKKPEFEHKAKNVPNVELPLFIV
jgi:hypothetical protein